MHVLAQSPTPTDIPTDVGDEATAETASIITTIFESLPRIGLAIALVVVGWLVAKGVRALVRRAVTNARDENAGRVIGRVVYGVFLTMVVLLAVTVVFPSVSPVDLLAGLGIFSIAIGFAFQDILSNLLAGILLLVRQPFEVGDQIEVSGQTGTVQAITIRETQIKTFDGQKIVIPNAEVYQSVIRVQTAYGPKRTVIGIGLEDHQDLDQAAEIVREAVQGVDGVLDDPAVQCFFTHFADSTTNFDVRYWTDPEQANVRAVQDRVVRTIGTTLRQRGIDMPSPIRELDARPSLEDALSD